MQGQRHVSPAIRTWSDVAVWQGGVIGRDQLLAARFTAGAIDERVRSGALVARHRGVYDVAGAAIGMRGRAFAALLAAGPEAVLSHRSAGAHWVILAEPAVPEVTAATQRRVRPGLVVHRSATLATRDVVERAGLRVTSPLRTLLDLATVEPAASLERAVAEAQVLGLVDPAALRAAPPHRGRARLLAALDGPGGAPDQSRLERDMARLIRAAGLPRPHRGVVIAGHRADFAWTAQRVIAEVDGWSAHGHRLAFERDRARDRAHALAGWTVVRFTARQIAERPLEVAAQLAALLSRAT